MSAVDICNRALQKVGANARITALTDASKEARECNRAYDPVRLSALRLHPWNFAMERASLAALSTAPAWGYAKQYQLPSDCLRVIQVQYDTSGTTWKVEGRKILTDATAPLRILYTKNVTDTGEFDPQFAELLSHLIAIEIVESIAQSNTQKQLLTAALEDVFTGAVRSDGQEGSPDDLPDDDWITARA